MCYLQYKHFIYCLMLQFFFPALTPIIVRINLKNQGNYSRKSMVYCISELAKLFWWMTCKHCCGNRNGMSLVIRLNFKNQHRTGWKCSHTVFAALTSYHSLVKLDILKTQRAGRKVWVFVGSVYEQNWNSQAHVAVYWKLPVQRWHWVTFDCIQERVRMKVEVLNECSTLSVRTERDFTCEEWKICTEEGTSMDWKWITWTVFTYH